MWYQIPLENLRGEWTVWLGGGGGFVVFVVGRNGLQVFGFEHLVAIQAADVVNAIASRHDFGSRVLAVLHKMEIIPILSMRTGLSSPRWFWEGEADRGVL